MEQNYVYNENMSVTKIIYTWLKIINHKIGMKLVNKNMSICHENMFSKWYFICFFFNQAYDIKYVFEYSEN